MVCTPAERHQGRNDNDGKWYPEEFHELHGESVLPGANHRVDSAATTSGTFTPGARNNEALQSCFPPYRNRRFEYDEVFAIGLTFELFCRTCRNRHGFIPSKHDAFLVGDALIGAAIQRSVAQKCIFCLELEGANSYR